MDRLEQLICQHNVDVLFVDPLSELHNVEESDNGAMRAVVARFRELAVKHNIAVCILHHTRKGGASSPGDLDAARGASAIAGAVRVALTLCGMSEDDASALGPSTDVQARSHYVRLDDAKQNS
jgi:RecA-family ATPase